MKLDELELFIQKNNYISANRILTAYRKSIENYKDQDVQRKFLDFVYQYYLLIVSPIDLSGLATLVGITLKPGQESTMFYDALVYYAANLDDFEADLSNN